MKDVAIRVVGLSKQYRIGGPQKRYDRLGERLADALAAPLRRAGKLLRGQATGAAELDEDFWALRDVSFEIKRGETVGIIGRNGAGKSTLLKILSRITEPTEGYADIYGRVGSLLEVGTGFHPELTGRENIYLNAAILGMKRKQISNKFDEIVAFAEIDRFIDTPVKHYSSGMYVRLAFSVAAHLEPHVLLVDEVLAVGDAAFQRKCLGKMDDVAQQGRTVLFVSHNMSLIQMLCQRGIFLQEGQACYDGTVTEATEAYLRILDQAPEQDLRERVDRKGQGKSQLIGVEIFAGNGDTSILKTGQPARFMLHVSALLPDLNCSIFIYDQKGQPVTSFKSRLRGKDDAIDGCGSRQFMCEIDQLLLLPGRYRMDTSITGDNRLQDYLEAATVFNVGEGQVGGRPTEANTRFSIYIPHRWILPSP
jgi:lipopolysaccharide transport system ATP-binding protein